MTFLVGCNNSSKSTSQDSESQEQGNQESVELAQFYNLYLTDFEENIEATMDCPEGVECSEDISVTLNVYFNSENCESVQQEMELMFTGSQQQQYTNIINYLNQEKPVIAMNEQGSFDEILNQYLFDLNFQILDSAQVGDYGIDITTRQVNQDDTYATKSVSIVRTIASSNNYELVPASVEGFLSAGPQNQDELINDWNQTICCLTSDGLNGFSTNDFSKLDLSTCLEQGQYFKADESGQCSLIPSESINSSRVTEFACSEEVLTHPQDLNDLDLNFEEMDIN
jgi:hypothetical protein